MTNDNNKRAHKFDVRNFNNACIKRMGRKFLVYRWNTFTRAWDWHSVHKDAAQAIETRDKIWREKN